MLTTAKNILATFPTSARPENTLKQPEPEPISASSPRPKRTIKAPEHYDNSEHQPVAATSKHETANDAPKITTAARPVAAPEAAVLNVSFIAITAVVKNKCGCIDIAVD